jgi:Tfp pilus assembly protein PilW
MTLSLLVVAGIGQIYLAAKRSYDIQTNLAQIQDVGRYVVDVLTQDIHMAGYWGLMNINDPLTTITDNVGVPPPSDTCVSVSTDWGLMIKDRIFGVINNDSSYGCISSWSTTGGDALVVRYADPVSIPPSPVGSFTSSRLYIQTLPFQGILSSGDPGPPPGPVFSNHAVVAHAYYVANPIATDCGDVPVFAREHLTKSGTPSSESLVNGVEHLHFQYGVDTDSPADGSVNKYLNANEVTTGNLWTQVRAVRFWVLVRANCQEGDYTDTTTYQLGDITYTPGDHYRRTLYSSTVALRN